MSLLGSLQDVKLADVLGLMASGRKTGLLTVSAGPQKAQFRFEKGVLVHAVAGRHAGDLAVLDTFGWKRGDLTFVAAEAGGPAPNVQRSVQELILEGERSGVSLHRMNELIPNDRVSFQHGNGPAGDTRFAMGRTEWRVLRTIDVVRDVKEIVEASRLPRADVVRVLFELSEAGFVERVEGHRTLRVHVLGLLGGDLALADERHDAEWIKVPRFKSGVKRIEVRTAAGKHTIVGVAFRPGLFRDLQLPRATVADLGVRDGEDVYVRPAN